MTAKKPKRRAPVCTRYAVRNGTKYIRFGGREWGTFDHALLFSYRSDAAINARNIFEIVPVRCRALSAATKRSKKRTK